MDHTIDGVTNTENASVFMAENAEYFDHSYIINFCKYLADSIDNVIPLSDWEADNDITYIKKSSLSSFLDAFQKPVTLLENASDRAVQEMRNARENGSSLKATQALDRYKIAQARHARFETVLLKLVDIYQDEIGEQYESPKARQMSYSRQADKKADIMSDIDKIIADNV